MQILFRKNTDPTFSFSLKTRACICIRLNLGVITSTHFCARRECPEFPAFWSRCSVPFPKEREKQLGTSGKMDSKLPLYPNLTSQWKPGTHLSFLPRRRPTPPCLPPRSETVTKTKFKEYLTVELKFSQWKLQIVMVMGDKERFVLTGRIMVWWMCVWHSMTSSVSTKAHPQSDCYHHALSWHQNYTNWWEISAYFLVLSWKWNPSSWEKWLWKLPFIDLGFLNRKMFLLVCEKV